jgi:hypothetical protein
VVVGFVLRSWQPRPRKRQVASLWRDNELRIIFVGCVPFGGLGPTQKRKRWRVDLGTRRERGFCSKQCGSLAVLAAEGRSRFCRARLVRVRLACFRGNQTASASRAKQTGKVQRGVNRQESEKL